MSQITRTPIKTLTCDCCERVFRSPTDEKLCWECRGRPNPDAHHPAAIGPRNPKCKHDVPR